MNKTISKKSEKGAVVKIGGKQYIVYTGDTILVEKISTPKDKNVTLDSVLAVFEGDTLTLGTPHTGSKVTAKVIDQLKKKKITVVKYKPKTRYRRKQGHRQRATKITIQSIA